VRGWWIAAVTLGGCSEPASPERSPPVSVASGVRLEAPLGGVSIRTPTGWVGSESGTQGRWAADFGPASGSCQGHVHVEPAAAEDPARAAHEARRLVCAADSCEVHQNEPVLYNRKSGWRWEIRHDARRTMTRYTAVVRVEPQTGQRWSISVQASSRDDDYVTQRRCLDQITAAVSVASGGDAGRQGREDPVPRRGPQSSPR
jgi:hypothetical protein